MSRPFLTAALSRLTQMHQCKQDQSNRGLTQRRKDAKKDGKNTIPISSSRSRLHQIVQWISFPRSRLYQTVQWISFPRSRLYQTFQWISFPRSRLYQTFQWISFPRRRESRHVNTIQYINYENPALDTTPFLNCQHVVFLDLAWIPAFAGMRVGSIREHSGGLESRQGETRTNSSRLENESTNTYDDAFERTRSGDKWQPNCMRKLTRTGMSGLLLLLLFLLPLLTHAAFVAGDDMPPGEWNELRDGEFNIYYERQDLKAAEMLADWYRDQLRDFAAKLNLRMPRDVRVFIAPNEARFKYLTRGLPEWTGGAVYPRERVVVLLAPRVRHGAAHFKAVALHEGVHLLTELDGYSHLPKWMAEGLAVYLSGETLFRNPSLLARSVVTHQTLTLGEIEDVLLLGPEEARLAYLQSVSMVRYLVETYGWDTVAKLVHGFRAGRDPDALFRKATGRDYFTVEAAWHADLRKKYKWWGFLFWADMTTWLWIGAALLVVFAGATAIIRRRLYYRSDPRDPSEWEVYDFTGDSSGDDPWTYTADDEDDDDRY